VGELASSRLRLRLQEEAQTGGRRKGGLFGQAEGEWGACAR